MLNVVLFEPEIPPNTGNIIRLCANTGFRLHLIEPLGFSLEEKQLRRAGLDYGDLTDMQRWQSFSQYLEQNDQHPIYAFTTKGSTRYDNVHYQPGDSLVFGPETRGLPDNILNALPDNRRICLPMQVGSRSLNLSNVVAIAAYEAWRQNGFCQSAAKTD